MAMVITHIQRGLMNLTALACSAVLFVLKQSRMRHDIQAQFLTIDFLVEGDPVWWRPPKDHALLDQFSH